MFFRVVSRHYVGALCEGGTHRSPYQIPWPSTHHLESAEISPCCHQRLPNSPVSESTSPRSCSTACSLACFILTSKRSACACQEDASPSLRGIHTVTARRSASTVYNISMATGTLLSLTEFTHLPDEPGKQELSNGELVIMPPPKFVHQKLSRRIYNALHAHLERTGAGEAWAEAGFQLGPTTIRQPDVAVVLDHRGAADDEWLRGAPDIAIEVLSPANSAEDIELKISQYLASGAKSVRIVSPKAKQVRIYRCDGTHQLLNEAEVLIGRRQSFRALRFRWPNCSPSRPDDFISTR